MVALRLIAIILALVVMVGGVILFFNRSTQTKYENITVQEAERLIAQGEVCVIDVREPFEYAEGHIPGATLIPLGSLQSGLVSLNPDSSYLIVCRSGNRSAQAAGIMAARGFKNIRNMSGGMLAWRGPVDR